MPVKTSTAKSGAAKSTARRGSGSFDLAFERDKITPGAMRFREITDNGMEPVVGSIYMRKSRLDGRKPSRVRVTIHLD